MQTLLRPTYKHLLPWSCGKPTSLYARLLSSRTLDTLPHQFHSGPAQRIFIPWCIPPRCFHRYSFLRTSATQDESGATIKSKEQEELDEEEAAFLRELEEEEAERAAAEAEEDEEDGDVEELLANISTAQPAKRTASTTSRVTEIPIEIPKEKLDIRYARSGGPGGQNVNKVNTKVDIRFNVMQADWLPEDVKERLVKLKHNKINKEGELVIQSMVHRTQYKNMKEAIERLKEYIREAAIVPKEREMREGRTEAGDRKRLQEKKARSKIKSMRQNRYDD